MIVVLYAERDLSSSSPEGQIIKDEPDKSLPRKVDSTIGLKLINLLYDQFSI
jgi:hypothetical protein